MFDHSPQTGRAAGAASSTPSISLSSDSTEDSRRRHALEYLEWFSYPVELRTLAAHVAAAERNVPVAVVSDDARERVAIRLHHIDVPKLVAGGRVDYDPESRMVLYTGAEERERYAAVETHPHRSDPV